MDFKDTLFCCRFGSRDCGFGVDPEELDAFPEANPSLTPCGDANIQEYLNYVMEYFQLQRPGTGSLHQNYIYSSKKLDSCNCTIYCIHSKNQ